MQELRVVVDAAQRFLQVVRRDVGEVVELTVGSREFLGAVRQFGLGALAARDVAHDTEENLVFAAAGDAHGHFEEERRAVLADALLFLARIEDSGLAGFEHAPAVFVLVAAGEIGQQPLQLAAQQFVAPVAEQPRGGRVDDDDAPVRAHADDRVDGRVEDRLEPAAHFGESGGAARPRPLDGECPEHRRRARGDRLEAREIAGAIVLGGVRDEEPAAAPAAKDQFRAHRTLDRERPCRQHVGPVADAGLGALRDRARGLALARRRACGVSAAEPDFGVVVDAVGLARLFDETDDAERAGATLERRRENGLAEMRFGRTGDEPVQCVLAAACRNGAGRGFARTPSRIRGFVLRRPLLAEHPSSPELSGVPTPHRRPIRTRAH
jgi:hypothetical protein